MKSWIAALVVVLLLAPALASQDSPTDQAALQGRWKAWLAPEQFLVFEIRGNRFTLTTHSGENAAAPWTGQLVFDERASPKRVTWKGINSGGRDLPDNECIYELHGETWLVIGGGGQAPAQFFSGGGQGHQTLVFKRERAK